MNDRFGRRIDYLRISITDRCNERCLYCMPRGYRGWACAGDRMAADEIVAVAAAAADLGFRKIRLTGGEPLVRQDVEEMAQRIWDLPGIEALGLSTNGIFLAWRAAGLKRAGVRSVNVSLDALEGDIYRQITGGDVERVLEGLAEARRVGFEMVKLNCVLLRGVNEGQLTLLLEYAARWGHPLRLIELMPMAGDFDFEKFFMPLHAAVKVLGGWEALEPMADALGHGPARYWRHRATGARIGLIGALTMERFCATCNKLRLTSDGKLRPCLGREGEIDLRAMSSPAAALQAAIANKPEDHIFRLGRQQSRPMTAIGG